MSICLARIDERLLHGLVANQWVPYSKCTRVMVIDNEIANNQILKNGMRLARPAGVSLSIINEETAIKNFKVGKYDYQKVLVLTRSAKILIELLNQGIEIPKINVGSTSPDKEGLKVSKQACLSEEELEYLKSAIQRGVPVLVRYALLYSEVPLEQFLE